MAALISVILPVFNGAEFLRAAVDSILSQSLGDFELILIDDGSTDGSADIVAAYASADKRVIPVVRENRGIAATLNEGISRANGEFVARMDADDISEPDRFRAQHAYMAAHPKNVLVGGRVVLIDQDGDTIAPWPIAPLEHEEIVDSLLDAGWPLVHPSVFARTAALRACGGYRPLRTWQDHDLFLRLSRHGQLANLPDLVLSYRVHAGSIVHTRRAEDVQILEAVLNPEREVRGMRPIAISRHAERSSDQIGRWAWWALGAGNVRTARKHAWRLLRQSPLDLGAWRLAYCAIRGR